MSGEGMTDVEQGKRLGVNRQRIRRWRVRWAVYENENKDDAVDAETLAWLRRVDPKLHGHFPIRIPYLTSWPFPDECESVS